MKSVQLLQGDCLELMKDIPDKSIDMILCDLPYGTTKCKWDAVIPFEKIWGGYERIIKDNGAIVLFSAEPFTSLLITSNLKWFRYDLIWKKPKGTDFLNANVKPLRNHENIAVFYKKRPTYNKQFWYSTPYKDGDIHKSSSLWGKFDDVPSSSPDGRRNPLTVMDFKMERGLHPTQKPVALLEYLVKTYTHEGETVLDNCMGSGSTGVACVNTGRKFIGMELDKNYFEIAKNRIVGE